MSLGLYVARRLLALVPTLFFVSVLIFLLQQLLPGDPALALAGEEQDPAAVAAIRAKYHLDRPIGPAVSYSIGQGATMISACCGVFVWHEFAGAPRSAKMLLFLMFVFFLLGLGSVALAPLY